MHLVKASDPILRRKCRKVTDPTALQHVVYEMDDIRERMKGLGLAAPQVGIAQRFFVTAFGACFNPRVLRTSDTVFSDEEACLSLPNIVVSVPRPIWIEAEWLDENGKKIETTLSNLNARVFLHELDHLDGRLITDYLE